jgi:hypothetical protein
MNSLLEQPTCQPTRLKLALLHQQTSQPRHPGLAQTTEPHQCQCASILAGYTETPFTRCTQRLSVDDQRDCACRTQRRRHIGVKIGITSLGSLVDCTTPRTLMYTLFVQT